MGADGGAVPAGVKLSVTPGSRSPAAGPFDPSWAVIATARPERARYSVTPNTASRSAPSEETHAIPSPAGEGSVRLAGHNRWQSGGTDDWCAERRRDAAGNG